MWRVWLLKNELIRGTGNGCAGDYRKSLQLLATCPLQLLSLCLFLGGRTVQAQPAEFTCHAPQGCQQDIWPQPAPKVGVLQHQRGAARSDPAYAETSWPTGTSSPLFHWGQINLLKAQGTVTWAQAQNQSTVTFNIEPIITYEGPLNLKDTGRGEKEKKAPSFEPTTKFLLGKSASREP